MDPLATGIAKPYVPSNGLGTMAATTPGSAGRIGGNTTGTGTNGQSFLESVLPGIGNLTSSATGVIQNLLNGLPSVSQSRTSNAYFGVGAGQPDVGGVNTFTANRGADLYGQQANQNRQSGLSNLFQAIGSYSSPILSNQAQQFQNQQFGANLQQQGDEFTQSQQQQDKQFQQNYQLQQFLAMLQGLGLGNNIVGNLPGNLNIS